MFSARLESTPEMSHEIKDKYFGVPLSEWIKNIPNELEVDAVGLWQIVASGKDGFGLKGKNLTNFLAQAILGLLEKGAKPVRSINGNWVIQNQYGNQNHLIISRILNELEQGAEPDEDGIWFLIYIN